MKLLKYILDLYTKITKDKEQLDPEHPEIKFYLDQLKKRVTILHSNASVNITITTSAGTYVNKFSKLYQKSFWFDDTIIDKIDDFKVETIASNNPKTKIDITLLPKHSVGVIVNRIQITKTGDVSCLN